MIKQKDNNTYIFSIKNKKYEIFFTEDGAIEIYEEEDPGRTGFIFEDSKKFIFFINSLTDIAEKNKMENG